MNDRTDFEGRLTSALATYAERAPVEVDAASLTSAIARGRAHRRWSVPDWARVIGRPASRWAAVLIVLGLTVALIIGANAVGAFRSDPIRRLLDGNAIVSTSPTPATSTTSSTTPSATPAPSQSVSPPGATQSPLPPLPPSRASNGWIAYSTDGQNPGSTDITTGSDIYLVREGGEPRLIAGREGGTTRNVCPAFSPDGHMLAYGVASPPGRAVVVVGVDANGVIPDASRTFRPPEWQITRRMVVPGSGPAVCPRWSTDGTRLAYLDGPTVDVRGLDGSTLAPAAGDPGVKDLERGRDPSDPLLSPAGDRIVRIASQPGSACQIVVSRPGGTAAHAIALADCGYAIAAWSPDGRQVLLLQEVGSADFALRAIGVDSTSDVTIVSTVGTNGARSEPGRGDVSWQPVFP